MNALQISLVPSATDTATQTTTADAVVEAIRTGGRIRPDVERIRAELQQHGDKKAVAELKKQLPGVLWSGTFTQRANAKLVQHSGLLCADLDGLNGDLSDVRERLQQSPHLWALFLSPSGEGLKAVFRVPGDAAKHAASFRAVEKYVHELTGKQIDQSCKDPARLCFLSYDPDIYHNGNATEIILLPEPAKPKLMASIVVNLTERQCIAADSLGAIEWQSDTSGFAACPGKHLHTSEDRTCDCRINVDGVPTVHCFHNSCRGILDGANHDLRVRIGKAEYVAPSAPNQAGATELQGSAVLCPDVIAWPDAVDGAGVLNEVAGTIKQYVALPDGAAVVATLWCAHTHCFECFEQTPRLNITSPEKGCGKSTLRDVLALFVQRPLPLENMTTATAFRLVQKFKPTILADETDSWLKSNDELIGFLNSGYRRGGFYTRCEGDNNEPRMYRAYAPAALCGIGNLKGPLHDRSIVIKLARAKPGELQSRFDSRRTAKEAELCRKLARWALDNQAQIASCEPRLPDGVFNRLADNWRPLFAIAEAVGGDWPQRCAAALNTLTSCDSGEVETLKVMLLADIREVIAHEALNTDEWISSSDLIDNLTMMTDRPWAEANRGTAINERWLSLRLAAFSIKPTKLPREGGMQKRGYTVAAFNDAFERYVSSPAEASSAGGEANKKLGLTRPETTGQVSQQSFLRGQIGETDYETDSETATVSELHGAGMPF